MFHQQSTDVAEKARIADCMYVHADLGYSSMSNVVRSVGINTNTYPSMKPYTVDARGYAERMNMPLFRPLQLVSCIGELCPQTLIVEY